MDLYATTAGIFDPCISGFRVAARLSFCVYLGTLRLASRFICSSLAQSSVANSRKYSLIKTTSVAMIPCSEIRRPRRDLASLKGDERVYLWPKEMCACSRASKFLIPGLAPSDSVNLAIDSRLFRYRSSETPFVNVVFAAINQAKSSRPPPWITVRRYECLALCK
jgi:hypothetical protein